MPSEPMVTIKDEQGNLKHVPLSQIQSQKVPNEPASVLVDRKEDPVTRETEIPESAPAEEDIVTLASMAQQQVAKEQNVATETEESLQPVETAVSLEDVIAEDEEISGKSHELAMNSAELPAMTTPNTHMFEHAEEGNHAWDSDDHASLLDESLTSEDLTLPHEKKSGSKQTLVDSSTPAAPSKKPSAGPSLFTPPKPVPMQDIVSAPLSPPPQTIEPMGPIAELRAMTLDDFRRLGGRGEVGIEELRQKFSLLLSESVLLYMQGVAAWQQSPLYEAYKDVLAMSVRDGKPVATVLSEQGNITQEEFDALVSLQADLRL